MSEARVTQLVAPTDGLFVVATAPAGWYEIDDTTRRWFDGRDWTDYYAPILRLVPAIDPERASGMELDSDLDPDMQPRPVVWPTGPNNGLHLVMAIMTLGLWLPVWGVVASVALVRGFFTRSLHAN